MAQRRVPPKIPAYLEGAVPYAPEIIQEYTSKGWWQSVTYGDLLDRAAATYPDKTAIIDARGGLTYSALRDKVDRLAIALVDLGLKKYDRVLIQLPNRHEFFIIFYALQRIGAVPVLATPRHEYREVSHFFRLTEPVAWVIPVRDNTRQFLPLVEQIRGEAGCLKHVIMPEDGDTLPPYGLSMSKLISEARVKDDPGLYLRQFRPDPNDVALILPTSGTTGLPKGVPRTHNSYLAGVACAGLDTETDAVVGLPTPIGHGLAQQGMAGSFMMKGATLVLIEIIRAKEILEAIEKYGINRIILVPALLEDILKYPDLDKYDLTSLKMVGSSSAALRPETLDKAKELFDRLGTVLEGSAYGSTEGPCARHKVGVKVAPEIFRASIGTPMAKGDHWKVIDENEEELPPNTEGDLVAKGPLVFTGYYRSEADNREIFTHDGYYKMGDLGKIDESGNIYITGRKKDVIKRGGEGITAGEVENLLYMHPDIEAAAVIGIPHERLGEIVCACVQPKEGKSLTLPDLITFLKSAGAGKLLLPEKLEIVKELPRTHVGKIDKTALRQSIR